MHTPRRLPALFHRVFLSHLVVLAVSFLSALILVDYLFVDGITHFLVHSPIILIPVLLALIGLVGLLALWTSAAVALPLDRTVNAISAIDADAALAQLLPDARVEEVARVVAALRRKLGYDAALRPLYLRLDCHGNVRDGDIDTAARLGVTPAELRRGNLRAFLATPVHVHALGEAVRELCGNPAPSSPTTDAAREMLLHFRGAAGRILPARCLLYRISGDEILLIGIPGTVL